MHMMEELRFASKCGGSTKKNLLEPRRRSKSATKQLERQQQLQQLQQYQSARKVSSSTVTKERTALGNNESTTTTTTTTTTANKNNKSGLGMGELLIKKPVSTAPAAAATITPSATITISGISSSTSNNNNNKNITTSVSSQSAAAAAVADHHQTSSSTTTPSTHTALVTPDDDGSLNSLLRQQQQQQQHHQRSSSLVDLNNRVMLKSQTADLAIGNKPAGDARRPTSELIRNCSNSCCHSECAKCKDMVRSQLLDSITSENALVCKHLSAHNISVANPGLLIVERETALDAQTAALGPHLAAQHVHNPASMSHQKAKEAKFNQNYSEQQQTRARLKKKRAREESACNSTSAYCGGSRPVSALSRDCVPLVRQSHLASAERLKNYQHFQPNESNSRRSSPGNGLTRRHQQYEDEDEEEAQEYEQDYDYQHQHHQQRRSQPHQQQHHHRHAHHSQPRRQTRPRDENDDDDDEEAEEQMVEENDDYDYREEFYATRTSTHDVREIPIISVAASGSSHHASNRNVSAPGGSSTEDAHPPAMSQPQFERQVTYDKFYSKSNIVNRTSWSKNRKT
jgi:hypothetical protein